MPTAVDHGRSNLTFAPGSMIVQKPIVVPSSTGPDAPETARALLGAAPEGKAQSCSGCGAPLTGRKRACSGRCRARVSRQKQVCSRIDYINDWAERMLRALMVV